ncbi:MULTISPECIES: carbohydrate kinase family protein [Pseudomonas]|jgi:fructokinase|uniref:Fructokinase n=5 Tax=Pseudomonas fluorescens group TaxID=136843 RepID=C3KAU7_PSEFS|nr:MULTISPECIES: carbohydrate kinase [Pseudomonas]MBZ6457675.1 carbohydrate kinase [Pseudomonas fluorescens group sp.]MBZ6463999.1 carbohydrate kinase [Pseudomonas fluorescens group sp.]MBZ6468911.1 carbohydrate kinase [Pseudomonas fluorescens group sp.]MCD7041349.1 carbohydrate kinase [Pseudomonas petroselini]MCD7046529.1 carbohydrate kinase [Pseudomonas petroselini]
MYLVCGEALFDFFSEEDASGQASKVNYKAIAGGSPFNVAVGLRRLGIDAGLFGGVSTDFLGRRLLQVLKDEGVSEQFLVEFAAPTTLSMVAVGANGSPQYNFRGEGCADRLLEIDHLPALGADIRGLHIGSFSLVVQPIGDTLLSLVKRESGKRMISLDPNVRLNPQPDIQLWRNRVAELVKHADLIKVSDEDLHLLYPDQSPESVLQGWLQHRCQLVFLTRGGEGASVYSRQHGHWSAPAVKVVMADTVGAGDTFQAALIAWLTEQQLDSVEGLQQLTRAQIDAMLGFAIRAAALTCTKTGPDLPYRQQLG